MVGPTHVGAVEATRTRVENRALRRLLTRACPIGFAGGSQGKPAFCRRDAPIIAPPAITGLDGNPSGGPRRRSVTPRAGGRTRRHRKATGMRASERHGSSAARTRSGTCRSAAGGSLYPRGVSPSAEVWAAAGRALSQGPIDGDKTAYA